MTAGLSDQQSLVAEPRGLVAGSVARCALANSWLLTCSHRTSVVAVWHDTHTGIMTQQTSDQKAVQPCAARLVCI